MSRLKVPVDSSSTSSVCDVCPFMQSSYVGDRSCLSIRRACEQVRTLVEEGQICAALEAVPQQSQAALRVSHYASFFWFGVCCSIDCVQTSCLCILL